MEFFWNREVSKPKRHPKYPKTESDTFSDTKFFRYRNRYFFRYQNFAIPNPKPPKKWKSFETLWLTWPWSSYSLVQTPNFWIFSELCFNGRLRSCLSLFSCLSLADNCSNPAQYISQPHCQLYLHHHFIISISIFTIITMLCLNESYWHLRWCRRGLCPHPP